MVFLEVLRMNHGDFLSASARAPLKALLLALHVVYNTSLRGDDRAYLLNAGTGPRTLEDGFQILEVVATVVDDNGGCGGDGGANLVVLLDNDDADSRVVRNSPRVDNDGSDAGSVTVDALDTLIWARLLLENTWDFFLSDDRNP